MPDLLPMLLGFGALLSVVMLAVVLQRDPSSGVSLRYAAFAGSVALWGLGRMLEVSASGRDLAVGYRALASIGYCAMPALYLSLVQAFTRRLDRLSARVERALAWAAAVVLLVAGLVHGPLSLDPLPAAEALSIDRPLPVASLYGFLMPVVFLAAFRHVAVAAREPSGPTSRPVPVEPGTVDLPTATLFLVGALLPMAAAELLRTLAPLLGGEVKGLGFAGAAFNSAACGVAVLTGGVLPLAIARAAAAVGDSVGDALLVADRSLDLVYRNEVARALLGDGGSRTLLDLFGDPQVGARICEEAATGMRVAAEVEIVRADGRKTRVTATVTAHERRTGDVDAYLVVAREVDDTDEQVLRLRTARDRLEQAALTDALTGLYNRRYLSARLQEECNRSRRYHGPFALAMLDLDGFKAVNDVHGHAAGDEVLAAVAGGLRSALRESDLVARLGGDEFVALLLDVSPQNVGIVVDRIREHLRRIRTPAAPGGVEASIGLAFWEAGVRDAPDTLLEQADSEMYRDKRARREGRGTSRVLRMATGAFRRTGATPRDGGESSPH